MNNILSICIPTYNRIKSLRAELEYLLPVTSQLGIPIYVSDNASSDGTEEMVYGLKKKYDLLYYDRSALNLGPDYNFEHVLKMSSAQYAWLFSDDDIIERECLKDIIAKLKEYKPDLMVLNGVVSDMIRVKDVPTHFYTDANAVLNDIGWHMQWMSCLIFNNKMIECAHYEKFRNSYLLQFGIIFDYFAQHDSPRIYWDANNIVSQSSVSNGEKGESWADKTFLIFVKNWCNIINNFNSQQYKDEAKHSCIIGHGINTGMFKLRNIVRLSLKGIFTKKILKEYDYYIRQAIDVPYWQLYAVASLPKINEKQYDALKSVYRYFRR